jgi:hypothetical protein
MTWVRQRTPSDWIKLPYYIYKVFKHLPMQWMAIWVHPYFINSMEVCQAGWTWVTTVYKPYQYDIVKARNHFRLNYKSIL